MTHEDLSWLSPRTPDGFHLGQQQLALEVLRKRNDYNVRVVDEERGYRVPFLNRIESPSEQVSIIDLSCLKRLLDLNRVGATPAPSSSQP